MVIAEVVREAALSGSDVPVRPPCTLPHRFSVNRGQQQARAHAHQCASTGLHPPRHVVQVATHRPVLAAEGLADGSEVRAVADVGGTDGHSY